MKTTKEKILEVLNKYITRTVKGGDCIVSHHIYDIATELESLQSGAERGVPFDEELRDELINFCKEYKAYYHSIVNLSIAEKTDYEKFIDEYLKSRTSVTMHDLLNDDSAREERK